MQLFPRNQVRLHGRSLARIAMLGIACIALLGFFLIAMPWLPDWNPQAPFWRVEGITWEQSVHMTPTNKLLLSLAATVKTLAWLAPLVALYRLGRRLHDNEPLSQPVAGAFRWLAHSLPAYMALSATSILLAAFTAETSNTPYPLGIDFGNTYLFVISCLCLYSVAHLMRLATEAADDARSIV